MEVEALEAIYMTDFEVENNAYPKKVSIRLIPHPDEPENNYVAVKLSCEYTPNYPSDLPQLTINAIKGLSEQKLTELHQLVQTTAEENLGMAMIYTIAEAIREWLVNNNIKGQSQGGSMYDEMMARERAKQQQIDEEEENQKDNIDDERHRERERKRREGTPVTIESFNEWQRRFEEEMTSRKPLSSFDIEALQRPTGRQIFEQHLYPEDEDEEDEEDEDYFEENEVPAEEKEEINVISEHLFINDDDLPSDEEEDEEEEEEELAAQPL